MNLKRTALILGMTALIGGAVTAVAAPGGPLKPSDLLNKLTTRARSAPLNAVTTGSQRFKERQLNPQIAMRLHRTADQYALFAHAVQPAEEKQLVERGWRVVDKQTKVRDHTIFNHEAYIGYMVGQGGPTEAELQKQVGKDVKVRFRTYQGGRQPVLTELAK